ncbi:hypothetical protein AALP_AA6G235600 [Arabis alpina]|uniref:Uncharacterized protein n=1 Tax=Arabis alpina TaxID=50452 RepID=A0A087GR89_ARAAL|nr:hypothetical protein AALP_AA6G235600 [Arabis alpina]
MEASRDLTVTQHRNPIPTIFLRSVAANSDELEDLVNRAWGLSKKLSSCRCTYWMFFEHYGL